MKTLVAATTTGSSSERSLRLLARLAEAGCALSLVDLAEHLALPKPTAHRLCTQLLKTGFIARDIKEREFVGGPALRKLVFGTLNHGTVRGLRHAGSRGPGRTSRRDLQPHDPRRRRRALPRPRRGAVALAVDARRG